MRTAVKSDLKTEIQTIVSRIGSSRDHLIPILQEIQNEYREITPAAVNHLAQSLKVNPAEIFGVISFYSFLGTKPRGEFAIHLCGTISCRMAYTDQVASALQETLGIKFGETSADRKFTLEWTNCLGMCDQGPAMLVNDKVFVKLTPDKAKWIINQYRQGIQPAEEDDPSVRYEAHVGKLTFASVEPGQALKSVLAQSRLDVISMIRNSNLRGRGGAGFPTGVKWNLAAAVKSERKFIVCNADEGEPGTFKDRGILTDHMDLVAEGMVIAAYAIGATHGYIYLRAEYTYLRNRLEEALGKMRKDGLLGKNVLGKKGFDFDIEIRMGAGAYVCGEETALIESLEGSRGNPRNRPPFPVEKGVSGYPTIVNNVETLAWIPCIIIKGADWFKKIGTDKSAGLKLFSVSGDCGKPGIYELPLGITVAELLKIVDGREAKAVIVGGASGHCVTAAEFERAIAFEDVPTGGSIIVLAPSRDMLAVAENFMEFFVEESCGACTPCREGNSRILEGLKLLQQGRGSAAYLDNLISMCEPIRDTAKCGLGQASTNAFLSIAKAFRNELLAVPPPPAKTIKKRK